MKTKIIFNIIILLIVTCDLFAQFQIGHKQITFHDTDRSNRAIQTEIYYPASIAGDNVAIASGQFPVIVFGHGFVMVWSTYQNFWDSIVPKGYIMAFPRTEGSMSPNHEAFGLDLKFLNQQFKQENINPSSFFYQSVDAHSAIMGHSMGGGSAFLACENNSDVTTLITLAAAVTNPSSIDAAKNVAIPSLVISGQNDCVVSAIDHQIPMYDSLASECKTFVSVLGGSHCYFGNYNFNCSFGEGTCSPSPSITREEQHSTVLSFLLSYLDFMLKENSQANIAFLDALNNSDKISYNRLCDLTAYNSSDIIKDDVNIYPNPSNGLFELTFNTIESKRFQVIDNLGKILIDKKINDLKIQIDLQKFAKGVYCLRLYGTSNLLNKLLIIR